MFAIGNPLGLERSVSQGIISTRNRNLQGLTYVQTTAEIKGEPGRGPHQHEVETKQQIIGPEPVRRPRRSVIAFVTSLIRNHAEQVK